jgi:hypothetical protein
VPVSNVRWSNIDLNTATSVSSGYIFRLYTDATTAKKYPGLTFTLYFNLHVNDNSKNIMLYFNNECDLDSPTFLVYKTVSVTFQSNGKAFTPIASGPKAWTTSGQDC